MHGCDNSLFVLLITSKIGVSCILLIFQSFRKPQCGCQGSLGCNVTQRYMGSLSPGHHQYVDYDDDAGDTEREKDVHDDDDDNDNAYDDDDDDVDN